MEPGFVIVLALIGIPLSFLWASAWRKTKEREFLHRERIAALDKGIPVLPEGAPEPSRDAPRNRSQSVGLHGVIWAGIGGGLLASSLWGGSMENTDMRHFAQFITLWAIPALTVGIGLLIYSFMIREPRSETEDKPARLEGGGV